MLNDKIIDSLEKDKNVQGLNWLNPEKNYNWFSDENNFESYISAVISKFEKPPRSILYLGSATGELGERLLKRLGSGRLTLVDISKAHLDANMNPETEKVCCNILDLELPQKYDLIITRSTLDYSPTREMQIKFLRIVRKHLNEGGVFVNQPAYISDITERDIIDASYRVTGKMGERHFQSSDMSELYRLAGLTSPELIGESADMILTQEEHIRRYNLTRDDIARISEVLKAANYNAKATPVGYIMRFEFPIYFARSSKN